MNSSAFSQCQSQAQVLQFVLRLPFFCRIFFVFHTLLCNPATIRSIPRVTIANISTITAAFSIFPWFFYSVLFLFQAYFFQLSTHLTVMYLYLQHFSFFLMLRTIAVIFYNRRTPCSWQNIFISLCQFFPIRFFIIFRFLRNDFYHHPLYIQHSYHPRLFPLP